jgi:hypothetical protein
MSFGKASKPTLISSSDGITANGQHIVTRNSVLTFEIDGKVRETRPSDSVRLSLNTIFSQALENVTIAVKHVVAYVPFSERVIYEWLANDSQGGLMFPDARLDSVSTGIRIHIEKNGPLVVGTKGSVPPTFQGCLTINLFRREPSDAPPAGPSSWDADAYNLWSYMHTAFADMVGEEIDLKGDALNISNGADRFRHMMNAHFADCSLLFGAVWRDFGIGALANESMHDFMRHMLITTFLNYHRTSSLPLPPISGVVTVASDQRVCSKCVTFMLGHGNMMRCPCHQVLAACCSVLKDRPRHCRFSMLAAARFHMLPLAASRFHMLPLSACCSLRQHMLPISACCSLL